MNQAVSTIELVKNALASKTIWGLLLMVLGLVAPSFARYLTPEVQQTLTTTLESIGGIMVAWGRATASGPWVAPAAPTPATNTAPQPGE